MKTKSKPGLPRLQIKLPDYGNAYYIERIGKLEKLLARRPRQLHIELIGGGEMPADLALLFRSVLLERSSRTQIITEARSSLQNGSVLVWLQGDLRMIRSDARIFFRAANLPDEKTDEVWKEKEPFSWKAGDDTDPEEYDHARVLELINEFLPVKELAGRVIGLPVLRQFGLVDNEKLDRFLAAVLGKGEETPVKKPARKRAKEAGRVSQK